MAVIAVALVLFLVFRNAGNPYQKILNAAQKDLEITYCDVTIISDGERYSGNISIDYDSETVYMYF